MKPFNLEKALAGEPVVTRNGEPVSEVHYFETVTRQYKVFAVVTGEVQSYTESGRYTLRVEHAFDLFMAPVKRVGWVNIYSDRSCLLIYDSEDEAKRERTSAVVATIKVEWEE